MAEGEPDQAAIDASVSAVSSSRTHTRMERTNPFKLESCLRLGGYFFAGFEILI